MRKAALFFLLLSSCNFRPEYHRPDLDIGESYRFELENGTEYANCAWWKQFQDPTLDYLIETALENNKNLQVATARVLEFYAQYKVAFSQFFPEINAVGGIDRFRSSREINFFPHIPGVPNVNNLYSLLLKFAYEIDFWGKIRNQTEAAKSIYLSQVYGRYNVILTLVSTLAASYILLKQYSNQLAISKLTYEARKESWTIASLRFDGGLVSEQVVKQAESEALSAEVQIKNFEVLIAKQEDLISILIGRAPGPIRQGVLLSDLVMPPKIPAGLPCDLLQNRPDILQAEEKILAANAEVGVARAAFFPTFALTGTYGQMATNTQEFLSNSANLWDIAIQAFEPLFTGWRITNQLNAKEAVLVEALYSYQQAILTALQEVSDALISHEKAKEKLDIQNARVQALEEYLHLANLRYFNGQNDYLTVLDAEKSLFSAQLERASTEGDLYLTLISLYKALGQGWAADNEPPLPEMEQNVLVGPDEEMIFFENKF